MFGYQPSTSKQNQGKGGRVEYWPVLRAILRDPLFPLASAYDLRRVEEENLVAFDRDTGRWGLTEDGYQTIGVDSGAPCQEKIGG